MKYNIHGLSINVARSGSGSPTLVFLHYWGGTSKTWNKVVAELEDKYATVAYDMRGWGQSDQSVAGYTLADLADEALAVILTLKIESFVLVGHSLGGKVAQLVASRNPGGLQGVVLVAPAPPTPLRFPDKMRDAQIHAYDNRKNVLKTMELLSSRMPGHLIVEQIVEDSMSGNREATLAYPTSSILDDISAEVGRIDVPTLVLAGDLDQLDSVEQHKREVVSRIPNAEFAIIKGSGHLIPIDEPIQLAKQIASFVAR